MTIPFYKYQGTGNDFIIINSFNTEKIQLDINQIQLICNRKFGIGSDGLILIKRSIEHHFKMEFFNPDGSQSFCGNGARCAVQFAYSYGIINNNSCDFEAFDGIHKAYVCENEVKVEISNVGSIETKNIDHIEGPNGTSYFLETGSPHFASYVEKKGELNSILEYGKKIRFSDEYKNEGVNVNLIYGVGSNRIEMRTYERGVEDETLSCGTGATACALIHSVHCNSDENMIEIETKGGVLKVSFDKLSNGEFANVHLIGPAKQIFHGQIEI